MGQLGHGEQIPSGGGLIPGECSVGFQINDKLY
jgi:hypothetical protein